MKKKLCLAAALVLSLNIIGCGKVQARLQIRQANDLYDKQQYAEAIRHYQLAKQDDSGFPDLDRLIGYSNLGLFKPEDQSPANQQYADRAIASLREYLEKRPEDAAAREVLINLFLNANRTQQAIDFFKDRLKSHPADLDAVKSIATLYAKQGNFNESLNWYEKITMLDSHNPEAFYVYGVVCYEKVAKNPPADLNERLAIIEKGMGALQRGIALKPDYFEANVYMNLLFREQAKVETDPVKQATLYQQADLYRNRAMEINKARKKSS